MRASFFVTTLAALAVVEGCVLMTSFDGLTGGAAVTSQDDASVAADVVEAASSDAVSAPDTTMPPPLADAGSCHALVCDDFETPALAALWIPNTTSPSSSSAPGAPATIEIDSLHVHSGQRAVHMHIDPVASGSVGEAFIAESQTIVSTPDSAFARAYFFVPHSAPYAFVLSAYGQAVSPWQGDFLELAKSADGGTGSASLQLSALSGGAVDVGATLPLASWFCVEWEVDFTAPQGTRIWVDDVEVTSFNRLQNMQPSPPVGFFDIGPEIYYPGGDVPAIDVWIDDVVIDTKRINCN